MRQVLLGARDVLSVIVLLLFMVGMLALPGVLSDRDSTVPAVRFIAVAAR